MFCSPHSPSHIILLNSWMSLKHTAHICYPCIRHIQMPLRSYQFRMCFLISHIHCNSLCTLHLLNCMFYTKGLLGYKHHFGWKWTLWSIRYKCRFWMMHSWDPLASQQQSYKVLIWVRNLKNSSDIYHSVVKMLRKEGLQLCTFHLSQSSSLQNISHKSYHWTKHNKDLSLN